MQELVEKLQHARTASDASAAEKEAVNTALKIFIVAFLCALVLYYANSLVAVQP
jgi:hypothetical protein